MLCPQCNGKGLIVELCRVQPCDECGGQGRIQCCEGLQAQPEPEPHGGLTPPARHDRKNGKSQPRFTASVRCGRA